MSNNSDNIDKALAIIERMRAKSALHYDNTQMDSLAKDIVACERLFKADPETKELPHRSKPEKVSPKEQILSLVRTLDHSCPRRLMVNAEAGTIDTKAGSLIAHVDALSVKRNDLDRFDEAVMQRRAYKKDRPALVRDLRAASEPIVEAMGKEIRLLREGIQSKRTRTYSQMDNDPSLYRAFAQSFVTAAKEHSLTLGGVPALRTLVHKTQCHLALLDYVDSVRTIAQEMKDHPPSLWDDNRAEIAQKLAQAADSFRAATPDGQRTTPDVYKAFMREDARVREATSASEVERASEHLKDIALTFIMGGPPNPEKYGVHPPKDVPSRPKIFSRISAAYREDRKHFPQVLERHKNDQRTGRTSEEGLPPIDPLTTTNALMDHVYAARWVLAADRVEALVKTHIPMLADPTIDTVHAADKPRHIVNQIELRGQLNRTARTAGINKQPETAGFVQRRAAQAQSSTKGHGK